MSDKPTIFERHNEPATLIHCTQGALQKAIAALPESTNNLSEKSLEASIDPTELDYLLRTRFSREVQRVRFHGGVIKPKDIYEDYCSKSYFYTRVLDVPRRLAFMIRPMPQFEAMQEAMLYVSNKRMWELINLPVKVKGKVQPRLCDIVLSAAKMIKENVKGMPVQNYQLKSVNVNVDATTPARFDDMNMDQLEKEIKKLETKLGRINGEKEDKERVREDGDREDNAVDTIEGEFTY